MDVINLMAQVHDRLTVDLQRYLDASDATMALHLCRDTLARLRSYLSAQEAVLFPAFAAVAACALAVPLVQHRHLKQRVSEVSSLDGAADGAERDKRRVGLMLKLQQETHGYVRKERADLCAVLRRAFSAAELQSLGERMRREMGLGGAAG